MTKANRNTKPSALRYKAAQEDVRRRVNYAVSSGETTNPYPADDRRHARFQRELRASQYWDDVHDDMCQVYGVDQAAHFERRIHPNPGPVVPYELLGR